MTAHNLHTAMQLKPFFFICAAAIACICFYVMHVQQHEIKAHVTVPVQQAPIIGNKPATINKQATSNEQATINKQATSNEQATRYKQATINKIPTSNIQPTSNKQLVKLFQVQLTNKEMSTYKILIKTFVDHIPNTVTYFLSYGSLLGAYRHHGIIPWDVDVDIIIKGSDRPLVKTMLKSLSSKNGSDFGFLEFAKVVWRIYNKTNNRHGRRDMSWPYIDIFSYHENITHMWDFRFPWAPFVKTLIFPLRKIPFMGQFLPAPYQTRLFLETKYDIDVCRWTRYRSNPIYPTKLAAAEVNCDLLMDKYGFVKRRDNGSGITETLEMNGIPVPGHIPFFLKHDVNKSGNGDK